MKFEGHGFSSGGGFFGALERARGIFCSSLGVFVDTNQRTGLYVNSDIEISDILAETDRFFPREVQELMDSECLAVY